MESDLLRFILFIVAAVVILGIFFWDRHKKVGARIRNIKRQQSPVISDNESIDTVDFHDLPTEVLPEQQFEQPVWQDEDPEASNIVEPEPISGSDGVMQQQDGLFDLETEPVEMTSMPDISMAAPAVDDALPEMIDEDSLDSLMMDEMPLYIVQLNIIARSKPFTAKAIWQCADDTDLVLGDMRIFHRYSDDNSKKVLYSIASMFEPGTLPDATDETFTTEGLTLFAQFPGARDCVAVFSDMLFTAERMGAMLDGELQDDTHSALTRQTIEHIRGELLEHRRQVQLARKRLQ